MKAFKQRPLTVPQMICLNKETHTSRKPNSHRVKTEEDVYKEDEEKRNGTKLEKEALFSIVPLYHNVVLTS